MCVARHNNVCVWKIYRLPICLYHPPGHGASASRSMKELEPVALSMSMKIGDEVDPPTVPPTHYLASGHLVQALDRPLD